MGVFYSVNCLNLLSERKKFINITRDLTFASYKGINHDDFLFHTIHMITECVCMSFCPCSLRQVFVIVINILCFPGWKIVFDRGN